MKLDKRGTLLIIGLTAAAFAGYVFGSFRLHPAYVVILPGVFVFGMGMRKFKREAKNGIKESSL